MAVTTFKTVQSFIQFLWGWFISGGVLVDQNTANIRAEICVGCHNNLPSDEVRQGCSSCRKAGNFLINKIRSSIIKGNSTPSDGRLLTCGICGCDGRISVWIPNHALLSPEDANAYPTFCWRKKRLQNLDV